MKQFISAEKFYNFVYSIIGNSTPLKVDCGKLCNNKCCQVTDEITGMYLFPHENEKYKVLPEWGYIYDTDFSYGENKYCDLFTCDGYCERKMRPLSCRIFPLTPYCKRGEKLKIILDPRGKGMCPLASYMKIEDIDSVFLKKVHLAMKLCMKIKDCREFIYALSESFDEEKDFFSK